jgi:hypothetical protein
MGVERGRLYLGIMLDLFLDGSRVSGNGGGGGGGCLAWAICLICFRITFSNSFCGAHIVRHHRLKFHIFSPVLHILSFLYLYPSPTTKQILRTHN